jgi:integrase
MLDREIIWTRLREMMPGEVINLDGVVVRLDDNGYWRISEGDGWHRSRIPAQAVMIIQDFLRGMRDA